MNLIVQAFRSKTVNCAEEWSGAGSAVAVLKK